MGSGSQSPYQSQEGGCRLSQKTCGPYARHLDKRINLSNEGGIISVTADKPNTSCRTDQHGRLSTEPVRSTCGYLTRPRMRPLGVDALNAEMELQQDDFGKNLAGGRYWNKVTESCCSIKELIFVFAANGCTSFGPSTRREILLISCCLIDEIAQQPPGSSPKHCRQTGSRARS